MEKVRYKKGKKNDFSQLTSKDANTIYILNESGDFSENNNENNAELYIGSKRITPEINQEAGQNSESVMSQKSTTDFIAELTLPYSRNGYKFKGLCTPNTNIASTNNKCYYIAATKGDYVNFGNGFTNIEKYSIFVYDGEKWGVVKYSHLTTLNIKQEMGFSEADVMSQKAVTMGNKDILSKLTWNNLKTT